MMSGIQRQPLQKHNIACSSPDASIRNGSTLKTRSSGMANNAVVWQALDMSAMSTIHCGTPTQDCQLPNPRQSISAHLAAWQKQLSACATNSRRGPEGLPLPSRQPSARDYSSAGELRTFVKTPCPSRTAMLVPGFIFLIIASFGNALQICSPNTITLAAAPTVHSKYCPAAVLTAA